MSLPKALMASLVGLAVVTAACEIALRVAGYEPFAALRSAEWRDTFLRVSPHPGLVYDLVPGARGFGWRTEVSINSLGFRDREVAREKPAGVARIAAIGDSLTFGNRVAAEETYPKVLERQLVAQGMPFEVLNLGVAGYDTLEAVFFLEAVGLQLEPDLIVLGYCINDAGTASVSRTYIESTLRYTSWIYRPRIAQWIATRRARRLLVHDLWGLNEDERFARDHREHIANLSGDAELKRLMQALAELLPDPQERRAQHAFLGWYASPPHVGKVRHAFERLAELSRSRDLTVLLLVLPYLDEGELPHAYDLAYAMVQREARRVGFDVLDLGERVRAAGPDSLRAGGTDPLHFNAGGHELIARHLHDHLEAAGHLRAARGRAAGVTPR